MPAAWPTWPAMVKLLQRYVHREEHARVPLGHVEGGVRLGAWVSKQWSEHQAGRLSNVRTHELEVSGVDWGGPPPEASGSVGPKYLNERKWDYGRGAKLAAEMGIAHEFDPAPLAAYEPCWHTYDAERDQHSCATRGRRATNALLRADGEGAPPPPYPLFGAPRVKGIPPELGLRLERAKTELVAERKDLWRRRLGAKGPTSETRLTASVGDLPAS